MSKIPKNPIALLAITVAILMLPLPLAAQDAPDLALVAELEAVAGQYRTGRILGSIGTGGPGAMALVVGGGMVVGSLVNDTGWSDITLVLGAVGTGVGLGLGAGTLWQILVPSALEDAAAAGYATQEELVAATREALARVETGRKIRGAGLVVGAGLLGWMAVREYQTSGEAINPATWLSLVAASGGLYDLLAPSVATRRVGPLVN